MHRLASVAFLVSATLSSFLLATDGDLDITFGNQGKVVTDFFDRTDVGSNLIIDKDGKIILAGSASKHSISDYFALARYNENGSLDKSFGQNGQVVTRSIAEDKFVYGDIMGLGQLSDGRIIVAGRGYSHGDAGFALVAYNTKGALEPTFADEGAIMIPDIDQEVYPLALTIDEQDRIIMVASSFHSSGESSSFAVFRFHPDGSIDERFGAHGQVVTPIVRGINVPRSVKVAKDGAIVVGGFNGHNKFVVVKYLSSGSLDANFGQGGIATINFNSGGIDTLNALIIQRDGKIVVGGDVQVGSFGGIRTIDFGLARLTNEGLLDLTFNKTGTQITYFSHPAASSLWALALQDDGKIIAAGDASFVKGLGIARYQPNGELDESFGHHGKQIITFDNTCHWEAVALQADHKIVAGGYVWNGKHYDMAVTRLVNARPYSPLTSLRYVY